MWLLEPHTLGVQGLFIPRRSHCCFSSLSFISLFKVWQNALFLRCAMAHTSTNPLMKVRKAECGGAKRAMCNDATRHRDRAGWLFLVFRVEKSLFENLIYLSSLICLSLCIIFLQRWSCVLCWLARWQVEVLYESHSLCVLALCSCILCVCICMPYHPSVNV